MALRYRSAITGGDGLESNSARTPATGSPRRQRQRQWHGGAADGGAQ